MGMNQDTHLASVLIVDDTIDTLRLLSDLLSEHGYDVRAVTNGRQALEAVERDPPDLILLDIGLPELDGYEVCRRLRSSERSHDVPVIFITALSDTTDKVRAFEAGGVDYVTKPIAVEEMLARIRVHLANARLTQSARAALDVSGRYLLAVNGVGKIMWATPQAQKLLSDTLSPDSDDDVVLPDPIPQWLDQARKGKAGSKAAIMTALPGDEQLRLQYMGRLGSNEFLLRLAKDSGADAPAEFSSELGLTTREGEVLSWLSKGKTNRDIAQILGLSPRTVDKHLEQIYSKLGVENRTAAAAIAVNAKHRKS
jgi:DNA-binding NarL/FixJ family response regulator